MDEQIQKLIERAKQEAKGIAILNTADQLEQFYLSSLGKYKSLFKI